MSVPSLLPRRANDLRRSRRFAVRLRVEFQGRGGRHVAESVDVARHGLFIRTPEVVLERHVVALDILVPTGPLRATGVVTRGKREGDEQGFGVQFFALGGKDKARWDAYLDGLQGTPASAATPTSYAPVYLLKPADMARLRAFYFDELAAGHMGLSTPVLRDAGDAVAITVIHPRSQQEFTLQGVVASVQRRPHKRMEVQFHRLDAGQLHAFHAFMETGDAPHAPAPEATTPSELPGGGDDAWFEVDLLADDVLTDHHVATAEPAFSLPPLSDPGMETPLEVGESEPDGHAAEREFSRLSAELRKDTRTLRVACGACGLPEASFSMGSAPGAVGILVEMKPHWCARCGTVVSMPVLVSPARRRHLRERLAAAHGAALEALLPASVLFEVADLLAPPRCGACNGNLAVTDAIRALERTARGLDIGERETCHAARCPCCEAGAWVVTCVSGRVAPRDTQLTTEPPVGDG